MTSPCSDGFVVEAVFETEENLVVAARFELLGVPLGAATRGRGGSQLPSITPYLADKCAITRL
jgi:hypothetical protein